MGIHVILIHFTVPYITSSNPLSSYMTFSDGTQRYTNIMKH